MRAGRLICLLACTALLGCGAASSEGGVTGTGISAISGNILLVSDSVQQDVPLPFPIRVTIAEFPGFESTTDSDGTFQLDGAFSGSITLQFANATDGTEIGPLLLEVPAGSQTVVENIEIHTAAPLPERVLPEAVRQFDAFGRADLVECQADGTGVVLVTDAGRPARQFMVHLTADTGVVGRDGAPLTCLDIDRGATVLAEGFLRRDDQTIIAVLVVVAAPRPPQPGLNPRPESLRGVVDAVSCERGLVEVEQADMVGPVHRVVRLTDHTEFRCDPDVRGACDCSAIVVGGPIAVAGTILPARPGQVRADVIALGAAFVPVDLSVTITRVACSAGGLLVQDAASGQSLRVVLTPDTQISCGADLPCGCADLRARERIRLQGQRPADGGPVTADRITVLPRGQGTP